MRKFFILTLMVACLMMVSCVERRNQVILEKFVPISPEDSCAVKDASDKYHTEGNIDLAFAFDYKLAFQLYNYIPASDGGKTDLASAEANYFYAKEAEIEYEWDPKPQLDENGKKGRQLKLNQELWNKKKKEALHGIVIAPDGGHAAGWVHIFNESQIKNLLEHVNDIDWIESPLVVKVRVIGSISDGTTVKTNLLRFNIIPSFGTTIQMGSVYPMPEGGFQETTDENGNKVSAAKNEYDTIMNHCAFNESVIGGCFSGVDLAQSNCYAGDDEWARFIAETYGWEYFPGYAAAAVVEMIYNNFKKSADDKNTYVCCPGKAPEAPEEEDEEENSNGQQEGGE